MLGIRNMNEKRNQGTNPSQLASHSSHMITFIFSEYNNRSTQSINKTIRPHSEPRYTERGNWTSLFQKIAKLTPYHTTNCHNTCNNQILWKTAKTTSFLTSNGINNQAEAKTLIEQTKLRYRANSKIKQATKITNRQI